MKKRVWAIATADANFRKKFERICERHGVACLPSQADMPEDVLGCVHDVDTAAIPSDLPNGVPIHAFSRREQSGTLPIPTPISVIEQLLLGARSTLTLLPEKKCAALGSRVIALTDMEYALLECLVEAGGEGVSAKTLLAQVWDDDASEGTVTVYVHYLRQKLELGTERIVRYKRGKGYYVEPKYLKANAEEVTEC